MRKRSKKTNKVINLNEAREKRRLKKEAEAEKRNAKLERLEQERSPKARRQAVKTSRRRYFAAGLGLLIFLVIGFSMFNIVNLKMQEAEAIELQKKLLDEKQRLQTELSIVHSPAYIEQQARTQLKMIKPGERLYIFPEKQEAAAAEEGATGEEPDAAGINDEDTE